MSRFGTKEILNAWADLDIKLDYNFIPGVQCETFGRSEFYTEFFCGGVYIWSEYLTRKLIKPSYYYHLGASPFVYADAFTPNRSRRGSLVFLPKWDIATGLDFWRIDWRNFWQFMRKLEQPIICLAPADQRGLWQTFFDECGIKLRLCSISDSTESEEFQLGLAYLLSKHKTACFSFFSSAVLYAYYNGCDVRFYDIGNPYIEHPTHQVDSYANPEPIHGEFQDLWIRNQDNSAIMDQLCKIFLAPHLRQTPEELKDSLYGLNLYNNMLSVEGVRGHDDWWYSNSCGDIDLQYLPKDFKLLSRHDAKKKLQMNARRFDDLEISGIIKDMEARL